MTPKTDDLVKLLSCPFCGSEAIILDELLRGGHMVIGCKNCECPGGRAIYSADDEDAMTTAYEKWNRRTQPPQDGAFENTRAMKLLRKGKPFIVVAFDELYYGLVYAKIRQHEKIKGRWTDGDESEFIKRMRQHLPYSTPYVPDKLNAQPAKTDGDKL